MARRLALLTLLAALCAALTPQASAAAKARRGARYMFEVAGVDLRGHYSSAGYSGGGDYRYFSEFRYRSTVDEHGVLDLTPKRGRLFTGVIDPVEYDGASDMQVVSETESWQCGMEMPDRWAPERLSAIFASTGATWTITWIVVPPAWRCPQAALRPTVPGIPTELARSSVSVAKLKQVKRGRFGRINLDVEEEWTDEERDQMLTLRGTVELLRLR
jgi:hypothetical protein